MTTGAIADVIGAITRPAGLDDPVTGPRRAPHIRGPS
jgi:hypothetical protein